LHIDILFKEGEGRTLEGLEAAHRAGDTIVQEIRKAMRSCIDAGALDSASLPDTEDFRHYERKGRMKLLLVKIVSGLGNMYDTAVGPDEPAGFIGSVQMRAKGNSPILLTPTEVLDGTLHSLL
jgi:hypothetical protein